jgi:hypothetical protein
MIRRRRSAGDGNNEKSIRCNVDIHGRFKDESSGALPPMIV